MRIVARLCFVFLAMIILYFPFWGNTDLTPVDKMTGHGHFRER